MIEAIKALLKAQSEMGAAVKNSKNPHFKSKYADLEAVVNATMGAFHANGFAVLQRNDKDAEGHFVETKLMHSSGDTFDSKVYLVLGKNDMQGLGSAITYARRYGLLGLAGIAPEDDDGNATVANKKAPSMELDLDARIDAAIQFYKNCDADKFAANEARYNKLIEHVGLASEQYDMLFDAHNNRKAELMK